MGGGHVARMERREAYAGVWWENLRGKRPLGRPRRRWEDNIKIVKKSRYRPGVAQMVPGS